MRQRRADWDPAFMQRGPWFWPLAAAARAFEGAACWPSRPELDAMHARLTAELALPPLRFVAVAGKRALRAAPRVALDQLYDGRIALHGEVPTREHDWHDFWNALCFTSFPRAKRALHLRQFRALERRIGPDARALPAERTREQDALTLFDEGGAVIAAEPGALAQLLAADAPARADVLGGCVAARSARVVPFGHALFDHLHAGLRCPGGSTRLLEVERAGCGDRELVTQVDRRLAAALEDPALFQSPREGAFLRLRALGLAPDRL